MSNRRTTSAAQSAGLAPAAIGALLVQGDDRPGLGRALSTAIAGAGINLHFLMALVAGRRYAAVFGFGSEKDATQAVGIIKKAAAVRGARARRKGGKPARGAGRSGKG